MKTASQKDKNRVGSVILTHAGRDRARGKRKRGECSTTPSLMTDHSPEPDVVHNEFKSCGCHRSGVCSDSLVQFEKLAIWCGTNTRRRSVSSEMVQLEIIRFNSVTVCLDSLPVLVRTTRVERSYPPTVVDSQCSPVSAFVHHVQNCGWAEVAGAVLARLRANPNCFS